MDLPTTTQTSTLRNVKLLHVEPTDVCQAACPLCARETDLDFDKSSKNHLDMAKILQVFDAGRIATLDKMYMCGNYGDPAAGKHTIDIYRKFREINPKITLGMKTNGALRTADWRQELGSMLNRTRDYVVFSIDGLEDTNHVYRKNVEWNKLIANAKAYIAAGGNAHWDMLVYQHNQHQVEQCKQLAKSLGFKWFRSKVSMRPLADSLAWPVNWLQPTKKTGIIQCNALAEQSMYIDAQGRVSVCSWLGSTQTNFISNIDAVQGTWNTTTPHPICSKMCTVEQGKSSFNSQWRNEIEL